MNNWSLNLFSSLCVLIVMAYESAYGQANIMPQELVEFAKSNKCTQVSDFFENAPGARNPPYVYGYLPGDEENSAVFWCKNTGSASHPYSLMFVRRDAEIELRKLEECPFRIEWDNPPRGLSVYKDRKTTLQGFVYLRDPKKKVPQNVQLSHNAIMSYYDGVSELFYCHNGEWLVRQSH